MASAIKTTNTESNDVRRASANVGTVYNKIATDFSRTRYKVWPCVARFLDQIIDDARTDTSILVGEPASSCHIIGETASSCHIIGEPASSCHIIGETASSCPIIGETASSCPIIGEIGCGNGKNLAYLSDTNVRIRTIGIDISEELLEICRGRGLEVMLGSILDIPLDEHALDHTLSVAVIHHFKERGDRIRALRELARVTRLGGRILITVWARNQTMEDGKRRFATNDEMVGFKTKTGETHYRYYHLYDDGELADDLAQVPELQVIKLYMERGNYIAELVRV